MKLSLVLFILFISLPIFSKDNMYPIDSPDYDLGHMMEKCPKSRDKGCTDENGFKRKNAIYTSIVIKAPSEVVWKVMTDLPRYKYWNAFMPKLESSMKLGGKIKFTVRPGRVLKLKETLVNQAIEPGKRWCWGNKVLSTVIGYSQRCRWLTRLGKNKTIYHSTEKFRGNMAGILNFTQRKGLTRGTKEEAKALKLLAEYENYKFPKEGLVCNGEGECSYPSTKRGKREIIFIREFDTTKENLFTWLSEVPKIQKWLGNFKNQVRSTTSNNPYGVGHVRRIDAPFVGITDETITLSSFPHHIRYRATTTPMFKNHSGDMIINSLPNGKSELYWIISFDDKARAPRFIKWFTETFLKSSLKKLSKNIKK